MAPSCELDEIEFVHVKSHTTKKAASCTAVARSHVMRRAHRRNHVGADFRNVTVEQIRRQNAKHEECRKVAKRGPRDMTTANKLDPFDAFAVDTSKLAALLENRKLCFVLYIQDICHAGESFDTRSAYHIFS